MKSRRRRVLAAEEGGSEATQDRAIRRHGRGGRRADVAERHGIGQRPVGSGRRQARAEARHNHAERVLLSIGDQGSAVAEAAAHAAGSPTTGSTARRPGGRQGLPEEHGMLATGKVDVKTWLKLFPTDMIISAPPGSAAPWA